MPDDIIDTPPAPGRATGGPQGPTADERATMGALTRAVEALTENVNGLLATRDAGGSHPPKPAEGKGAPAVPDTSTTVSAELERTQRELADAKAKLAAAETAVNRRVGLSGAERWQPGDDPRKRPNLARAALGWWKGFPGGSQRWPERDALLDYQKQVGNDVVERTMSTTTGPAGGFWVFPEMVEGFIEILKPRAAAIRAGVRVITGLVGSPAVITKGRKTAVSYWVPELASPTATDTLAEKLEMYPHPLTTLTTLSKDLLQQTSGAAMDMAEEDMATSHGSTLDTAIFSGTGALGQPLGLLNQPFINSFNWTAVAASYGDSSTQNITDKLDAMEEAIATRDAWVENQMGWVTTPAGVRKLRTVKETTGAPLLFTTAGAGMPGEQSRSGDGFMAGTLHGLPFNATTNLANTTLIIGAWPQVLLGYWGAMEVSVSDQDGNNWRDDLVSVKIRSKVDTNVRHIEAFEYATNFTT